MRCVVLAFAILIGSMSISHGAARYDVSLVVSENGPYVTLATDTQAVPPATISGSYQSSPATYTHYLHSYWAQSNRTSIEMRADADAYDSYGTAGGWWESATFRWDDVVFTCLGGQPTVDAGINVKIRGTASHISTRFNSEVGSFAGMAVYLGHPQALATTKGIWHPHSNTGVHTEPSSGVFSHIDSDTLDGTFSYPLATFQTGVPVTVSPNGLTIEYTARNGRVIANFDAATTGAPGMALPTDGPVFDLPAGCTCNSPQMGVIDNRLSAFGIIRAEAPYGGDDGVATTIVVGAGFRDGASVLLRRAGSADIVGARPTAYENGTRLRTQFDLRGAAHGLWDIVVENPGGDLAVKEGSFEVQPGTAPHLSVSVIGGSFGRIVVNRLTPFTAYVTNHGNTDAVLVFLNMSGVPASGQWVPDFDEIVPDSLPFPREQIPFAVDLNGTLHAVVIIPRIAPGRTVSVPFRISVPTFDPFTLSMHAAGPLLPSTWTPVLGVASTSVDLCDGMQCLIGIKDVIESCLNAVFAIPFACVGSAVIEILNRVCELQDLAEAQASGTDPELLGSLTTFMFGIVGSAVGVLNETAECAVNATLGRVLNVVTCLSGLWNLQDTLDKCCSFFLGLSGQECGPEHKLPLTPVGALDPNDKLGSGASSTRGYIASGTPVGYQVVFENLATATAPAQQVEIVDPLPASLEASSLQWGPIRFGSHLITPDPFAPAVRETVDLRPRRELLVTISGDVIGGTTRWRLSSLDPSTGQPPTDPLGGFLPPNVNPPEGEGSISMLLRPLSGLLTDTEILNGASIVFDSNPAIATGIVRQRIDADPPQSSVVPLAATVTDTLVPLNVVGSDVGAGIMEYLIFVSEDDGAPVALAGADPGASIAFTGRFGHRYAFYSVSRDSAGNVETPPPVPDAVTRIVPTTVQVDFTLDPATLSPSSQGRWVTGYLEPPAPYTADVIDVASILLNDAVPVDQTGPISMGDHDSDGVPELAVKFSRGLVALGLDGGEAVPVRVSGLVGGLPFVGATEIRVLRANVGAPAAGSVVPAGGLSTVRWEPTWSGQVEPVALLSAVDDGASWALEVSGLSNNGTYEWRVPNVAVAARLAIVHLEAGAGAGYVVDAVLGVSKEFSIANVVGAQPLGTSSLALRSVIPDETRRSLSVSFSLPTDHPATVAVYDVRGRRLATRDVGALGPGDHTVSLMEGTKTAAGVYFVRLSQSGQSVSARVALVP